MLPNEVERNRIATARALAWIVAHPLDFLRLAVRKQLYFLGEDDWGLHRSVTGLRHASSPEKRTGSVALLAAIANGYWCIVLFLLMIRAAAGLSTSRAPRLLQPVEAVKAMCIAIPALVFVLHSILESRGEYHVGLIGLLAALAAQALVPDRN